MKARILSPSSEHLREASRHLHGGGVVGMPTETVYGLAGSAFSVEALAKIFAVKERPTFDPLIVHVGASVLKSGNPIATLSEAGVIDDTLLSEKMRNTAEKLMRAFWPGPLTLVLPRGSRIPDLATSGLRTVGVRLPRHPVALALIEAVGLPLAAPSANRFGRISPTAPEHVAAELGDRIELILDGGRSEVGIESTVVSLATSESQPILLRPGGISRNELERILGAPLDVAAGSYAHTKASAVASPGMLESHYAPRTPLRLLPATLSELSDTRIAELTHSIGPGSIALLVLMDNAQSAARRFATVARRDVTALTLAPDGRLETAAHNLFQHLRTLDAANAKIILAEPCPASEGLSHAIADRLNRAAFSGNTRSS